MVTLGSIIAIMLITIAVGKRVTKIRLATYLIVVFLTLIQVGIVLVMMYTIESPEVDTPAVTRYGD